MWDMADLWYEQVVEPRAHHQNHKGYAVIYAPDCPIAWSNGQLYRCRYVAWAMGWLKYPWQVVHHVNRNQYDDRPSNLQVLREDAHQAIHKHFSDWHRRRISEAQRGKVFSAETRRKISESLRGKTNAKGKRDAEALANIRAGVAKRDQAALNGKVAATLKRRYATGEIKVVVSVEQREKIRRSLRKLTDEQLAEAHEMHDAGFSCPKIAAKFGLTTSGIDKMLKRYPRLQQD